MPITTTIPVLSTPPSRSDPTNFAPRGDTFLGELPGWGADVNTVGTEINNTATAVNVDASAAAASAVLSNAAKVQAEQAVLAATAVSGATKWVSGTSYAEGAVAWSPINGQNYRRKSPGGVSTTDPTADPSGWYSLISLQGLSVVEIAVDTAAVSGRHYVFTASCILTLPAAPVVNDVIEITNMSGTVTCTVNPSGLKIRGDATTMTVDSLTANTVLTYTGVTNGWV
jgi:hypothetical protein